MQVYIYVIIFLFAFGNNVSEYACFENDTESYKNCDPGSLCVPLSECPLLKLVMKNKCAHNTINLLNCGSKESELYCCADQLLLTNNQMSYLTTLNQVCGLPEIEDDNYKGLGKFPFAVRLGHRHNNDPKSHKDIYVCNGSILSERYVLTAAHCLFKKIKNYYLLLVQVGKYYSDNTQDCNEQFCALPANTHEITTYFHHPMYTTAASDKTSSLTPYDIGLILLKTAIEFSVLVQPICLPETWLNYDQGILNGWGNVTGQKVNPDALQALELPIIKSTQCANKYWELLENPETHICAGGKQAVNGCGGFEGAPLITRFRKRYYQIGIMSNIPKNCGANGVPSVYTNVMHYINWIKQEISTKN